ncbi:MAG TPA: (2Fe-2S)-binding protein [Turneriella sp.]|nr:(2Fe-2S)-binding protein [Turneriella sp.]
MIICSCARVNDKQIRHALAHGSRTIADLQNKLGVSMHCGKCREAVQEEITKFYGASEPPHYFPSQLAPTN